MKVLLSRPGLRTNRRAERISSWRKRPLDRVRLPANGGSILPIAIVYLFLSQMLLFGLIQVYKNQFYLHRLTENHYKAQTLLYYADYWLQDRNKTTTQDARIVPVALAFEEGTVAFKADGGGKVTATVTLKNDYSEKLLVQILPAE